MDFQFELGNTLDTALRRFQSNELAPSFLINTYATDYEIALETFFALYKRGYIKMLSVKNIIALMTLILATIFALLSKAETI